MKQVWSEGVRQWKARLSRWKPNQADAKFDKKPQINSHGIPTVASTDLLKVCLCKTGGILRLAPDVSW